MTKKDLYSKVMPMFDFEEFEKQERYPLSEEDTYVQQMFKRALNKSVFWKLMNELGVTDEETKTESGKSQLFKYVNGNKKKPPMTRVYILRDKIQPSYWYYKVKETLPKEIKYKDKGHNVEDLKQIETCGLILLKDMAEKYTLSGIEKLYGYDANEFKIKNTIYKRKSEDGKMYFKSYPQYSMIRALKDVITPDLWFIFPDELEQSIEGIN